MNNIPLQLNSKLYKVQKQIDNLQEEQALLEEYSQEPEVIKREIDPSVETRFIPYHIKYGKREEE